jgi:hypothetical protein
MAATRADLADKLSVLRGRVFGTTSPRRKGASTAVAATKGKKKSSKRGGTAKAGRKSSTAARAKKSRAGAKRSSARKSTGSPAKSKRSSTSRKSSSTRKSAGARAAATKTKRKTAGRKGGKAAKKRAPSLLHPVKEVAGDMPTGAADGAVFGSVASVLPVEGGPVGAATEVIGAGHESSHRDESESLGGYEHSMGSSEGHGEAREHSTGDHESGGYQ